MRKLFELGGLVAAAVLIAFGIVALVMGVNGNGTVNSTLKNEYITGSPDMTPAAIAPEVKDILASQQKLAAAQAKAGVPVSERIALTKVEAPSCSVAGKAVTNGSRARCFAQYMRIHSLGATGGLTYSQMGRWFAKPGTPVKFTDFNGATSDPKYAVVNPTTQQPVSNALRDLWVTETALTTALNTSYMATQISLFGIVVGIALLLSGIGFGILAVGGALRAREAPIKFFAKKATTGGAPVPTT